MLTVVIEILPNRKSIRPSIVRRLGRLISKSTLEPGHLTGSSTTVVAGSTPIMVSKGFIGGRIKYFSKAWELISTDPWILNVVRHGLELDFEAQPVMILSKKNVQLRVLASLLGDFTWASLAVPFARSHYREVQSLYLCSSKFYREELDTKVDLTDSARSDLLWWITNIASCQGRPMFEAEPTLSICSDASLSGWGAVLRQACLGRAKRRSAASTSLSC
uniref:Uncharacterized protein n=1 Tax=Daphnia galeata TaxID=27404 RepID=A0A8J2WK01_9CRUS|nr:unnamed protein product [Daphnia galeata]